MALQSQPSSMHDYLMGSRIRHPPSTNFDDKDDFASPPAKRVKAADIRGPKSPKRRSPRKSGARQTIQPEIPDSEDEDQDTEDGGVDLSAGPGATQLEATLPPVGTDEEATEVYEAYKAREYNLKEKEQQNDSNSTAHARLESRSWVRGRSSIYVDAFHLALDTVLEEEGHLFNAAELHLFQIWRDLSYEAQYLYVRLFLRKTSKWFRVKDLHYYGDVADMDAAVMELQRERSLPPVEPETGLHPGELEPPEGSVLGEKFVFAECSSEHITTLDEASSLLLLDELKSLAKEVKVQGKNKRELLKNFRRTSGKQTGLGFRELSRMETDESTASAVSEDGRSICADEEEDTSSGCRTPTQVVKNRDAHFTKKILDQTGRCIRLAMTPLKLFERVHLVFYRSTEWTEKSLTTLILAKISRRNFPEYLVSRSSTIFESRALLLEFEASLRTQFRVDNILEFNGTPGRRALEEVKEIFEAVYPRWKALLLDEQRKEDGIYESGEGAYLRRFSPAWVYTRIVHKALYALARFKEHVREHQLLTELLDQRLFHAARRGAWYQRKALLEEHYMYALMPTANRSVEANKKHWKRTALHTCEQGLQDKECHVIYHYDLQKRIKKLEKQLRLPVREQHDFGHVRLSKAVERDVVGIKIEKDSAREDTPSTVSLSSSRKNSIKTLQHKASKDDGITTTTTTTSLSHSRRRSDPIDKPPALLRQPSTSAMSGSGSGGSKTIWLDSLDTNLPVRVEAMCLSYYRHVLGYKGYHSEGGILRTLFGLLFYDILFFDPYIPNVFQTAYQTCPLDLHTDSFFSSRVPEIVGRINQISNGEAVSLARAVWDEHYPKQTCIVGVQWDGFDRDDLLELIDCWDGPALGTVMLIMAQEYQSRGGGVPDLILWKKEKKGENGVNTITTSTNTGSSSSSRPRQSLQSLQGKQGTQGTQTGHESHESHITLHSSSDPNGHPDHEEALESSSSPSPSLPSGKNKTKKAGGDEKNPCAHDEALTFPFPSPPQQTQPDIYPRIQEDEDENENENEKSEILFVEVKSANDRLSDTQRLWISALLGAGVSVELCHAVAGQVRRE